MGRMTYTSTDFVGDLFIGNLPDAEINARITTAKRAGTLCLHMPSVPGWRRMAGRTSREDV